MLEYLRMHLPTKQSATVNFWTRIQHVDIWQYNLIHFEFCAELFIVLRRRGEIQYFLVKRWR